MTKSYLEMCLVINSKIKRQILAVPSEKAMAPHSGTFTWKIPWTEEPGRLQSMGSLESDTTERLHFPFSLSCIGEGNGSPLQCSCLENPGTGEPGGLPSMGSHRVGHDWSDLAAAAAAVPFSFQVVCAYMQCVCVCVCVCVCLSVYYRIYLNFRQCFPYSLILGNDF